MLRAFLILFCNLLSSSPEICFESCLSNCRSFITYSSSHLSQFIKFTLFIHFIIHLATLSNSLYLFTLLYTLPIYQIHFIYSLYYTLGQFIKFTLFIHFIIHLANLSNSLYLFTLLYTWPLYQIHFIYSLYYTLGQFIKFTLFIHFIIHLANLSNLLYKCTECPVLNGNVEKLLFDVHTKAITICLFLINL